jgi:peptide/nickel transport system ATP-binding protein
LLASRLSMDPASRITEAPLSGDPPSPIDPPPGCRFAARCAFAEAVCRQVTPALLPVAAGSTHLAACHLVSADAGGTVS